MEPCWVSDGASAVPPLSLSLSLLPRAEKACARVPRSPAPASDTSGCLQRPLPGLWRDGALIDADDDFDFGVLVDGADFAGGQWVVDFNAELALRLAELPGAPYQSRVVDTYAHKVEVYDPKHGSFPLKGARSVESPDSPPSLSVESTDSPPSLLVRCIAHPDPAALRFCELGPAVAAEL